MQDAWCLPGSWREHGTPPPFCGVAGIFQVVCGFSRSREAHVEEELHRQIQVLGEVLGDCLAGTLRTQAEVDLLLPLEEVLLIEAGASEAGFHTGHSSVCLEVGLGLSNGLTAQALLLLVFAAQGVARSRPSVEAHAGKFFMEYRRHRNPAARQPDRNLSEIVARNPDQEFKFALATAKLLERRRLVSNAHERHAGLLYLALNVDTKDMATLVTEDRRAHAVHTG